MNTIHLTPTANKNTYRRGRLACRASGSAASLSIVKIKRIMSPNSLGTPQGCQGLPLANSAASRWETTALGRHPACPVTLAYEQYWPGAELQNNECPWQPQAGEGKQLTPTALCPTRTSAVGHPSGHFLHLESMYRASISVSVAQPAKTIPFDRARTCRAWIVIGRFDFRQSATFSNPLYGCTTRTISQARRVAPFVSEILGGTAHAQATTLQAARLSTQSALRHHCHCAHDRDRYVRVVWMNKEVLGIVVLADDPGLVFLKLRVILLSDHTHTLLLVSHAMVFRQMIKGICCAPTIMDSVALQPSLLLPFVPMSDSSQLASKDDLLTLERKIDGKLEKLASDIKRHFDVTAEALRHDVLGGLRDYTSLMQDRYIDHEKRLLRLEQRTV